jgi:hypothetical protein
MRRIPHLFLFTILALFTSATVATAADPVPASAAAPAANTSIASVNNTPSPSTTPPPLSDKQLKKLNDFLAAKGKDKSLGEFISNKFNLHENTYKQVALKDDITKTVHVYAALPDNGMLFAILPPTDPTAASYLYRLDSKFKIVASVSFTNHVPSEIKDPEKGAKAELAFWAAVADQLP